MRALAAARAASEAKSARPKRETEQKTTDPVTGAQRAIVVLLGVILLGAAMGLSYFAGLASPLSSACAVIGAVALSAVLPVGSSRPLVARGIVAAVFALAVVFGEPTGYAAKLGRKFKLNSGSPQSRVAAFSALRSRGLVEFTGVDLSGADMSGMNLAFLVFQRSKFVGTKLQRARLSEARLLDTDVSSADFSGADLAGVDMASTVGWERAKCDARTRMPADWRCANGSPASERAMGADAVGSSGPPPAGSAGP